ncbi:MAG: hypothetical protein ACLFQ7_17430 [Phormidium sp.]|nr:MAG: hypothetical protein HLUCCO16_09075 [Phormidium sp. OSCR]
MKKLVISLLSCAALGFSLSAWATSNPNPHPSNPEPMSDGDRDSLDLYQQYRQVIQRTTGMVRNDTAQSLVDEYGLNIVNVMWEDTARYDNSSVGPNISDLTIQVRQYHPEQRRYEQHLMPVIRHPNFSDITADIPLDQFHLLVGNHNGRDLERVSLRDVLDNLPNYLHNPDSWVNETPSLLAKRDTHVLVSAQACFLPIPPGDKAQFNPVLFNYQSYPGDPAVLTLLATREGTSITIIDNRDEDNLPYRQIWGQQLFFNQNGQRARLTGERLSDFQAQQASEAEPTDEPTPEAAGESGLNMVMVIQVPLKQKEPMDMDMIVGSGPVLMSAPDPEMERSNVEEAVIGHGEPEGPFTEIAELPIERHPDFPIRVTVQFYKATDNGVLSAEDVDEIHQQINRVYEDADYVGSLVVGDRTQRPTDYDGEHQQPKNWWQKFWEHYYHNNG